MTKSNIALSIGTAFALIITAAPAMAQVGSPDQHDQIHHDDKGGDRVKPDGHASPGGPHHHIRCRTVCQHHRRVRQCW
jgi:hypothetical protein